MTFSDYGRSVPPDTQFSGVCMSATLANVALAVFLFSLRITSVLVSTGQCVAATGEPSGNA
jgi:hypothetical protein